MRCVRSTATQPEREFASVLRTIGFRFRSRDIGLPGRPDLVIPSRRLAIFVDGDFWHGHQWRVRGLQSIEAQLARTTNKKYWLSKISRNLMRDFKNTASLLESGWQVFRIWESTVRRDKERCKEMALNTLEFKGKKRTTPVFSELSRLTVAEFFAGIGLVRLALERQGWRVVFANEIDPRKFGMYRENFGEEHFHLGDIHDLSADDVPSCALFTASFPCNDLSVAGGRSGLNGKQSGAFWGLVRILDDLKERRPPLVLLENVPGFLTSHGGQDLQGALLVLNKLGYVCDIFMLDASAFAPQSRVRFFVVGAKGLSPEPVLGLTASVVRPQKVTSFILSHPSIRWNLRPLPPPPRKYRTIESIIEELPEDSSMWWSRERTEYFINQLSPKHLAIAKKMISQGYYSYGTAFRRIRKGKSMAELRVDGIAGCLRTPRGGSGRQILFKAGRGNYWVRLLSPRECARLQGVPDESYGINAPLNDALFGFGDAVCVPVIEWIAEKYLTPLASELLRERLLVPIH
ncbi:MAG: DNA mismatch endonuclease Vsr [Acidobacteria bacterium]|nr:DNA mismatch endonuclease Vsr [Acidobacteriota bacterium]